MSDLLNSASLVMIPSGYAEDKVYSVVPSDGSGDMAFTRASNGTRVNSAGFVEVAPWNLYSYSEDFTDASWTKENCTISSNATTAPNGTTTADKLILNNGVSAFGATSSGLRNTLSIAENIYTYSVYCKASEITSAVIRENDSVGSFMIVSLSDGAITYSGGSSQFINPSVENIGNGWFRIIWTSPNTITSANKYSLRQNVNGNGTSGFFVWGYQLNIGSIAKPYFPTTDRLNVPRLTYQNGGGGCPSLLLEKQSTNLTTYSNEATQQGVNNMSATANTTISPDGTQNADTITPSAGTSDHYLITNGSTVSSGVIHTVSVFVKKKDSDYLYFGTGGSAAWGSVSYRFSTNTFFNVGGGATSYSATDMGNGWIRLTNTGTTGGTDLRILLTPSDSSGGRTFNANGTDGLYIWGLQIEQSSYVTSLIETTSSSATRVADACFKTGISSLIGQTEGVLFADVDFKANTGEVGIIMEITSGAGSQRVLIYYSSTTILCYANTGVFSYTQTTSERLKIAFAYKSGDSALYVNGIQKAVSSASLSYSSLSQLNIGSNYINEQPTNSPTNQAILFKTRLTNAELASLTTL